MHGGAFFLAALGAALHESARLGRPYAYCSSGVVHRTAAATTGRLSVAPRTPSPSLFAVFPPRCRLLFPSGVSKTWGYAASWMVCCPKRLSRTAALTCNTR
jgi:hypothetical protein